MKLTKVEYPKPVFEYFAVRATDNAKDMRKEFEKITKEHRFHTVVKLWGNGPVFYFYNDDDPERQLYEYLVITKISQYILGEITVSWEYVLMDIMEFDATFKEE